MSEHTYTISQLASEFDITTRSIRFYEEKGLLQPQRSEGDYRQFDKRDRTRLKLILRGKRFGMSLDEIADILGSASADMNEVDKLRKALTHFERVLIDLSARKEDIAVMEREVLQYVGGMRTRLAQLDGETGERNY